MPAASYLAADRAHALSAARALPERAHGAALFADISGFTPLADALARDLGRRDGAEALTRHLNAVYDALIAVIHTYGRSVVAFSGDAVTCWFDDGEQPPGGAPRAAACGFALQQAMRQVAAIRTPGGQTQTLALKVALASGPACRLLVGDPALQRLDVLAGATMLRLAAVEQQARPGEVVADDATVTRLGAAARIDVWRGDPESGDRAAVLAALDASAAPVPAPPEPPAVAFAQARPLLLPAVAERLARGAGDMPTELRPVVALFLRFATLAYDSDPTAGSRLDAYVRWVQQVIARYGGVLLDVAVGDKGSYLYAAFGAPLAHENDPERAVRAALELQTPPASLAFAGAPQIGIARGTMRTGAYGGSGRLTYGALGDAVNVAARLMQAAPPGHAFVHDAAAMPGAELFVWEDLAPLQLKGKPRPIPVARLLAARDQPLPPFFQGDLVGRAAELERLLAAVAPIWSGRFAGVCLVSGEAGVGKSRLVFELRQRLAARGPLTWAYCPADEIQRGSLRPFAAWLRDAFGQSAQQGEATNRAGFDAALDALIAAIEPGGAAGARLAAELERTRSFLAALAGLRADDSLYAQLDPKLRFDNTLQALVALIQAESLRRPVLLELEDAHWLDEDSRALLTRLTRALHGYPVAILCAARPDDGGRPFAPPLADGTPQCVVELDSLSFDGIDALAAQALGAALDDGLSRLVYERTGGNPFYAEQLLLDLRERGLLERRATGDDGAAVFALPASIDRSSPRADLPDTLNRLLIARLDRLDEPVREVVQTAAVLGREWDMPVLAAMRAGDDTLPPKVRAAEAGRVWSPLSERDYLFRHVLLRDAAYAMQAQEQRRRLHHQALQAIEQEYAEHLAPHYAALAYHARAADDHARERRYAQLAGEAAAARYANAEAIAYFSRALDLTPEEDLEGRWAALLAREGVEHTLGARDDQRRDIDALERLAGSLSPERQVLAAIRRAAYADIINDDPATLDAATRAVALVEQERIAHLAAAAYRSLAKAWLSLCDYPTALDYATRSLESAQSSGDVRQEGLTLRILDSIATYLGDYAQAEAYNAQSLALARRHGDRVAEAASIGNAGHFARARGDWAAARAAYDECRRVFQAFGNRRAEAMAYLAIGEVDAHEGDYAGAIASNQHGLRMVVEIGDRFSEGRALCNLGEIARQCGQYADAQAWFEQGMQLARSISNPHLQGVFLIDLSLTAQLQGAHEAARERAERALALFPLPDASKRAVALLALGHAFTSLGRLDDAAAAYHEAGAIFERNGARVNRLEALAGAARVALARGDVAGAASCCEPIAAHLQDGGTLNGADEPFWIALSCYQALRAASDPRAPAVLDDAYERLLARAARLPDVDSRRIFLENVPHHRELVAAWQAAHAA